MGNAACWLLTPALCTWYIHHYCPHRGYILWRFRALDAFRDSKQLIHVMTAAVLMEISYAELRDLDNYDDNNFLVFRTEGGWSVSDSARRTLYKAKGLIS